MSHRESHALNAQRQLQSEGRDRKAGPSPDPADGEETLRKYFSDLNVEISDAFAQLTE